ncbi:MAG: response regulator [Desulfovibrionaceae bacterium]|nr:response regulator [Desulfovibrionaceae bacterium]
MNKIGLTTKLMIVVSLLLLVANTSLGIILVNESKNAMKTLIHARMLDIANTAADMLDGDILKRLKKTDKGTKEYQTINDKLAVFQENVDLKYIYCIRDMGEGKFVFTVDPTINDPGEFGEPVVYTDALYRASKGKASVDNEPYTDKWGKFYSAYSPVFDSNKEVAGIVAVDFSADWYDAQIAKQTFVIMIGTLTTVLIGIGLLFYTTAKLRKQFSSVFEDLKVVAEDVNALTREINPNEKFESEACLTTDDIQELSRRIHGVRENLRQYLIDSNSNANSMITALSSEYRSVYYVDLDKNEGVCYQSHDHIKNGLSQGEEFPYRETLINYANKYITQKYREGFLKFIEPDNIKNSLRKEHIITLRYMVNFGEKDTYEMIRIAGVTRPEDRNDDTICAIGMGFTDVDEETRRTLTQSQTLAEALSAAEVANKAKTAFLSNMSHEIRTPMNAIIGLDRIALNDPNIDKKTRQYLEKIGSSANHLLNIINDILDMSRIEAGRMVLRKEAFSMTNLLDQIDIMIGGQCADKGLNWNYKIQGDIETYYLGDDLKLKQVLINILGNAVKFTPKGGSVTFITERTAHFKNKSTLKFIIQDTGIGMSEEYLPKIFDAFSQEDYSMKNKYGSTGLGMSITKSIVEMMNGNINVESAKNKGTTFTVTVTLSDCEQIIDESKNFNPNEMKVLIVDDDPTACELARIEFEKSGIRSESTLSGAKAVEMVALKHARGELYTLIVIDWKMPEMDGFETTKRIRSIVGNDVVIMIVTALQWDNDLDVAYKAGVDCFIAKPFNIDRVISQYNQLIAIKKKNASSKVSLEGKKILIAEDMLINAEILITILEEEKLESDHAENGKVAVKMFSDSEIGYYDAILMDMRMPEMDGFEATKAIRSMERSDAKTIPIIALTANAFDEDVQRSLQAGLNAHLSKPVDPKSLYETLRNLIK